MRLFRFLPAAIILFLFAPDVVAQTEVPEWKYVSTLPDAISSRYDDMTWLDTEKGWVVNLAGEIWHTPDRGESWVQQANTGQPYRSVEFRDTPGPFGDVGWAGTVNTNGQSILWETRDGGEHWIDITHRISGELPDGVCGIVSVGDHVWGVGAYHGSPVLIKSDNGGLTFTGRAMSQYAGTLVDVYFKNELEGYATGGTDSLQEGTAMVLRTLDGGETWEEVFRSSLSAGATAEWGWKISFPSDQVGYVSVEYNSGSQPMAKLMKTEDGGATWKEVYIDGSFSNAGLQGVGFLTENLGWASGRGVTSVTTDGGESWTQLVHYSPFSDRGQLDGRINRFYVVNDTLAFGVGQRLYVLSDTGTLGTDIEIGVTPEIFSLDPPYPNPFQESMTLPYTLDAPSMVGVRIVDVLGRMHRHLPQRYQQPGAYTIEWDGLDDSGVRVPSGNYILLIDIGDSIETKQVVFVK